MTQATETRPAVTGRSWLPFLGGFAGLCGVLLGTSAVDATGRFGPAILAAVLVTAVAVEELRRPASVPDVLRRLGLGRPGGPSRWRWPCPASSCWCSRRPRP